MRPNDVDKEKIILLVARWRERAGLSFRQLSARIQAYGVELSESALVNRLTGRPQFKPEISPPLTFAVIAAFTLGLTESERCRADEALEFASLARLPLDEIETLKQFFPEDEFSKALSRYISTEATGGVTPSAIAIVLDVKPVAEINRASSNHLIPVEGFMLLYQGDIIHTYIGASVILFFKADKSILQVPEQSTWTVSDSVGINDHQNRISLPVLFDEEVKSRLLSLKPESDE